MACRITELVLDCTDPEKLAEFWCEVLDFRVLGRDHDGVEIGREGEYPTIVLAAVPGAGAPARPRPAARRRRPG